MPTPVLDPALVEELAKRSAVLWLSPADDPRATALLWHVWHDGALWLVTGGAEQNPGPAEDGASVQVVLRSKASRSGRAAQWTTRAEAVHPGDARYAPAVAALHGARQSAPDGTEQPARWARESTLYRLAV